MSRKASLLLENSLTPTRPLPIGPTWTAGDGYGMIDQFHLSGGEYEHTSFAKAVHCIEHGQMERASSLSGNLITPKMIWTCISDGALIALKFILRLVNDIDWLDQVPEHIVYWRRPWQGCSSQNGENLREERASGWKYPWPPAYAAIVRVLNEQAHADVFPVLANWIRSSARVKDYARAFWEVGGFLEPSFCRHLIRSGASIDAPCRYDGMTALQIAAKLWEHDIVDILVELGADPTAQTPNGLTALDLLNRGPGEETTDTQPSFSLSVRSKSAFEKLSPREQARRRKVRIFPTLQTLCEALPTQAHLDQMNARGESLLTLAVKCSPIITQGLIREGADVKQADQWGRTAPMHCFCGDFHGRSSKSLAHLLIAGADGNAHDAAGHSVLHYWARQIHAMRLYELHPGFNRFNRSFEALTSASTHRITFGCICSPW